MKRPGILGRICTATSAVALFATAGCSSVAHPHAGSAPPVLEKPVISITPAGADPIEARTPIVVKVAHGVLTGVDLTNNANPDKHVAGNLSADKTTWTVGEPLGYGATYRLVAHAASLTAGSADQTATFTTTAPRTQTYPALIPAPEVADSYGVGQIFGVSFDEPVADKAAAVKAITVTSNPPQPGAWYWMDDKTAHYRPEHYWQPGTTVTVNANVYGVNLGDGVYGQTDRNATYKIHDALIAKADGNTEKMDIFRNGQLINSMPISLGSKTYPSHIGPHVISDRQPSVTMDSCTYGVCAGQPGYYKETVLLDERISNDGEFVHSAPWSVGQQGSDNVSHGCVNLSPANAQWFFDTFNLGDVVEIVNSGGPPLPVWDTYGDWELTWPQWLAGGAS